MDEMKPPGNGTPSAGAPEAPEGTPAPPQSFEGAPVLPQAPPVAHAPIGGKVKPKTSPLFFTLGLFTVPALVALGSAAVSSIPPESAAAPVIGVAVSMTFSVLGLVYAGFLIMLLTGRSRGEVRLASYGKGGLWSGAIIGLALVLRHPGSVSAAMLHEPPLFAGAR